MTEATKAPEIKDVIDTKELDFPDTVFVRDIENRVFQTIVLQCLAKIEGISLLEGNIIDSFLGRDRVEGIKGIYAEQDNKNRSVNVKVEVNLSYGIPIPEKANEIQTRVAEEITKFTGLHVACVHVVFKNVILPKPQGSQYDDDEEGSSMILENDIDDEYTEEF
ncbi:MAG: Asp23/Gls24 family envelope stress response protein [Waddliaceae bacterium]|jgi:uncharacterized alkaline shock family protein YloU|nr:Asp23/Gls24 family envelope stress response protein [Waddliaceae bacterium]MBT3579259.1 Asp23/Gls24 family envelope stress response protein [Waddliaceae bacterium]MBT4445296.1 Asp23/Gls24 family envelope stress response protein [Waddliaceae bacterium]MBT6928472.1 Asp23/Gls24 family envelope stress response protein [Waddliaceae bacterium]MBT7264118.1 Asp23/Gls24 family envelope stress response protein [Waddliaceae bacterium]